MPYDWRTEWPGVFARHADSCPVRSGGTCTCGPLGYRASVRDPYTGRRSLSPELATMNDARAWLYDQQVALDTAQQVSSESDGRLGSVIDDFLAAAQSGLARDSSGMPYTGERLQQLRTSLGHVDAEIGTMPIDSVRRRHVQSVVDTLYASGWNLDQIGETVDSLRSLYVYAVQRELVDFSPIVQLRSPTDGVATPPPLPHQTPMPTQQTPMPMQQTPMPMQQTPIPAPPQATTVAWQPPNGYEQPTYGGYPTYNGNGNGNGNGHPSGYMQTLANMTTPVPIQQQQAPEDPFMRALTPDKILWWSVLLIVIVAILIAIVLAAESV